MKTSPLFGLIFFLIIGWLSPVLGQSRWAVSINVAPTYAHSDSKMVFPLANSTIPASFTQIVTRSHTLGYSFGLMGYYAFSPTWSVSAGIWATQFVSVKGDFDVDAEHMTLNNTNKHPFEYAYKVPVMINYKSSRKRLSPYFSAGVSADFRSTSYVDLGGGQEVPLKFGKPVVFTPLLGIGAIYQLKPQVAFVLQPILQYNLQAHPSYVYYHAYQLSLQAQVNYRF